MDRKSKILLLILLVMIIGSVAVTYYRIMIKRDYIIEAQNDCDPYTENCFVWECDPDSSEEGEVCTGDADADTWFYKVNRRSASKIPICDTNDAGCDPWACEEGERDCTETLCDETSAEEQGVFCNDPVKFTEENPIGDEDDGFGADAESADE